MISQPDCKHKTDRCLLPAATCVICGRTLREVGGRRITAQDCRGMAVTHTKNGGGHKNFRRWIRLFDDKDTYVLIWGEGAIMTDAVIERIKTTYREKRRPWYCQSKGCGNRQCPLCGKAKNLPVASDILYDNGCTTYQMIIPADLGCVNPSCEKFREFGEGWGIVKYQMA